MRVALGVTAIVLFVAVGIGTVELRGQGGRIEAWAPMPEKPNAFVPPQTMPAVVRAIAEWNPVSAIVAACRDLFGNPNPVASDAWPMQNPVLASVLWCVLITAVFAPLAINKYKKAASK